MNRRRRHRRQQQQNNRPQFADVDQPINTSNGSSNACKIYRHEDCVSLSAATKENVQEFLAENFNGTLISAPSLASPSDDVSSTVTSPTDVSEQQFADFTFWKPLLPTIDDEIAILLNENLRPSSQRKSQPVYSLPSKKREVIACDGDSNNASGGENNESVFNEFQFWRAPIAEIDGDLRMMLGNLQL